MKGNYRKPLLVFEPMMLTQTITRDCSDAIPRERVTLNDPNSCVWDLGNGTSVFVVDTNCDLDGELMQYACYNNPSEGNYIFRS